MNNIHFVIGGAKSGKSLYAEKLILQHKPPYLYIATAEALDEEMKARIKKHQQRRGKDWITKEVPLEIVRVLEEFSSKNFPILVDCVTLWLSNLMMAEKDVEKEVLKLCELLERFNENTPLVIVSNEVGFGIVPDNELARRFRDVAGWTNQLIANRSRFVTMVVAGIPLPVKC